MHSQVFSACLVLTQMRFFSWSHHGELHSIMTQCHSCALNGCSHSLNGIRAHSMGVQGLFPLIHCHSCALNGCSHSLNGIDANSIGVQGLFQLTHWRSCALNGCWGLFTITQRHLHALNSIQRVSNAHSKAFTCTQQFSGGIQYSLAGIHMHSITSGGCSILTQM